MLFLFLFSFFSKPWFECLAVGIRPAHLHLITTQKIEKKNKHGEEKALRQNTKEKASGSVARDSQGNASLQTTQITQWQQEGANCYEPKTSVGHRDQQEIETQMVRKTGWFHTKVNETRALLFR